MKKIITFIFIALVSLNTYSQTSEGYVSIRGSGQFSCGEYMKWVNIGNKGQLDIVNQWVWGFLAAYQMRANFSKTYSIQKQGNISSPDAATVELFIKKHCSNNPLSMVSNASLSMVKELGGIVSNDKN